MAGKVITVRELIARLSTFDLDSEVQVHLEAVDGSFERHGLIHTVDGGDGSVTIAASHGTDPDNGR